jgi:hypothetical protein
MAVKHHSANSGGALLGAFGLKLWRGFARAGAAQAWAAAQRGLRRDPAERAE